MTFGEKIRRLRESCNLTQKSLGAAIDATQRKISYLETGKNEPSIDDLKRLCAFFKISADYLLGIPYDYKKPD